MHAARTSKITAEYKRKRNLQKSAEPAGTQKLRPGHRYVIQKHAARRLHYDFRLELDGVLKSWAVPKEPSYDPHDKRLAVQVEDHPLDYATFEGVIPKGQYGGGTVVLWDSGSWQPIGDPHVGLKKGKLEFEITGKRLKGKWTLVRMGQASGAKQNWLLIKRHDDRAQTHASESPAEEIAPALDAKLTPELATLVNKAPQGNDWIHETKFDGYRILAFKRGDEVTLLTRSGNDYTSKFPGVAKSVKLLNGDHAVFDGEIAVVKADGTTDFQALQNSLKENTAAPVDYFIFDVLVYGGKDVRDLPLSKRKQILAGAFPLKKKKTQVGDCKLSAYIQGKGPEVFETACRLGLEGIISKKLDSPYRSIRSLDWQKVKCVKRQEFVIGGYSEPGGSRNHFGSLMLGYYDAHGNLVYAGNVGTGFTEASLKEINAKLAKLEVKRCPFKNPPKGHGQHWVKPELVAEVQFHQWTNERVLRQASFKGLRTDKAAEEITMEFAITPKEKNPTKKARPPANGETGRHAGAMGSLEVAGVKLTHPDKILFKDQGLTKKDLADYYQVVADRMLPLLVRRPLSLVRCPEGAGKPCFFQRHPRETMGQLIKGYTDKKGETHTYIEGLPGLLSLVQFGALEIHPWGATLDDIDKPDFITFDLDPAPGVRWPEVVEAAHLLRASLETIGLKSFVKTSGGKGLHVVVPIRREAGWDEVKAFTKAVSEALEANDPDRFVATMSKAKRKGRIFIDYLRNARSATSVAAYSTRAKPNAPVSMPIDWADLEKGVESQSFTLARLLKEGLPKRDPWKDFLKTRAAAEISPGHPAANKNENNHQEEITL